MVGFVSDVMATHTTGPATRRNRFVMLFFFVGGDLKGPFFRGAASFVVGNGP